MKPLLSDKYKLLKGAKVHPNCLLKDKQGVYSLQLFHYQTVSSTEIQARQAFASTSGKLRVLVP